jgi:hypothetical protein
MMTTQQLTPVQAFEALRERVRCGLTVRQLNWFPGQTGRGERFDYSGAVADQSAAFPGRVVNTHGTLHVVATDDGQLALRLAISWTSIYGSHASSAEYIVGRSGEDVTIAAQWNQKVPVPRLDNILIHTGGVSVGDYHERALAALRGMTSQPVFGMLATSDAGRTVDPQELAGIAASVQHNVPLL